MKLRWTMPLLLSLGLIACDKKNEPAAATQPEPAETATVEGGEGKTDEAKPAEPAGTSSDRIKAAVAEVGKELAEGDKLAAAVDDVAALAKNADKGPLDAAAYEKLILDHATCEVKDGGNIDPKCPAVVALREAMSGGQALRNLAGGAAVHQQLPAYGQSAAPVPAPQPRWAAVGSQRAARTAPPRRWPSQPTASVAGESLQPAAASQPPPPLQGIAAPGRSPRFRRLHCQGG